MATLSGAAGTADPKSKGKKSANWLYSSGGEPNALIAQLVRLAVDAEGGQAKIAPTSSLAAMQNRVNSGAATYADFGQLAKKAIVSHKLAAAGMGGLAAGNIGGLLDNDKFGGQLLGAGLGAGLSGLGGLWSGSDDVDANPLLATALTMGGGEIGALFDKLRAKKEAEAQQAAQMAQYGNNYRNNGGYSR